VTGDIWVRGQREAEAFAELIAAEAAYEKRGKGVT
jgi:hypothetical protein